MVWVKQRAYTHDEGTGKMSSRACFEIFSVVQWICNNQTAKQRGNIVEHLNSTVYAMLLICIQSMLFCWLALFKTTHLRNFVERWHALSQNPWHFGDGLHVLCISLALGQNLLCHKIVNLIVFSFNLYWCSVHMCWCYYYKFWNCWKWLALFNPFRERVHHSGQLIMLSGYQAIIGSPEKVVTVEAWRFHPTPAI